MLKSVLFALLLLTTTLRLSDVVYLYFQDSTNLPTVVFVVTSLLVLYGVALLIKRFISNLHIRHYMWFFIIQGVAFIFNILYVALAWPLRLSPTETIATGTFLDILIGAYAVAMCIKQMRSRFVTVGGFQ